MPRGVRRSAEEKLYDVNIAIEATEEQLKQLKAQRKELEREMRVSNMKKLLKVMKEKQVTPEDLINMMMGD